MGGAVEKTKPRWLAEQGKQKKKKGRTRKSHEDTVFRAPALSSHCSTMNWHRSVVSTREHGEDFGVCMGRTRRRVATRPCRGRVHWRVRPSLVRVWISSWLVVARIKFKALADVKLPAAEHKIEVGFCDVA